MLFKNRLLPLCAILSCALSASAVITGCTTDLTSTSDDYIVLKTQGSFAIGGSTVTHDGTFSNDKFLEPDGQAAYGDHAYVFYQIPAKANKYPLIFQHGGAQSKRTWETTLDGRDGFENIFLKKNYSVYLVDQPRIGEAGLSTKAAGPANPYASNPLYADKTLYTLCRIGDFPNQFANSQFPRTKEALDQFQRCWTPYTGELDDDVSSDALALLFDKVGPAILVSHSMGGSVGWLTATKTDNVKAIVAFEPGGSPFIFPENEVPEVLPTAYAPIAAQAKAVPLEDFLKLTKIPIVLYYGDNIASAPTKEHIGMDKWRSEFDMAKKFAAAINRHGGNASVIHLPDLGIKGNTHFLMSDLNNVEIADLMENFLKEHNLN